MAGRRTEAWHPAARGLHAAPAVEVLGHLLRAQTAAAATPGPVLEAIAAAAATAAWALKGGHRLAYAGAGSSGLMALADCLELAGTFGIPPDRTPMLLAGGTEALLHMTGGAEDDPALARADSARVGFCPGDAVICVSASGGTVYTLEVAQLARAAGATVIGIANVPDSPLLTLADHAVLLDTGAEVIAGSTRMGAGTAQKVALNMISVLLGIALGHVHDGLMVNVVADNDKLMQRATGIVAALSGAAPEAALDALTLAGGAVKPAVLIAAGADPAEARRALTASGGHLAPALALLSDQP